MDEHERIGLHSGMDVQGLVGWNVNKIRLSKDITQEELALRVEIVAQGYISDLEAGKNNPTAVVLYLLANALSVEVGDLFSVNSAPEALVAGPVIIRSSRSGRSSINSEEDS